MTDRDELIDEVLNELARVLRETGYDVIQTGNSNDVWGRYRYVTFCSDISFRPTQHHQLDGEIRVYSPDLILFRVNPSKRKNNFCASRKAAMEYIKKELPQINVYKPT